MTEYDPLALARNLGVKLEVDVEQDPLQILAKPREKITDELRAGLKANRDDLIRPLLFRQAGEWIGDRPFEAPDEADEALNEAFYGDLPEFREALWAWAQRGLANVRKGEAA